MLDPLRELAEGAQDKGSRTDILVGHPDDAQVQPVSPRAIPPPVLLKSKSSLEKGERYRADGDRARSLEFLLEFMSNKEFELNKVLLLHIVSIGSRAGANILKEAVKKRAIESRS